MYQLEVLKKDTGERHALHFDEKECRLYDQARKPVRIVCADDREEIIVRIVLGTECNNSCIYCQQKGLRKTDLVADFDRNRAEAFVSRLHRLLSSRFTDLDEHPLVFSFWGGEPLLYLKRIQRLIPLLKNAFQKEKSEKRVWFSLITNGLLLSEETADLIFANDINVTLSHDGPGQIPCRHVEILDRESTRRAVERLLDAGLLSFLPVLSLHNPTLREWTAYMYRYIGNRVYRAAVPELAYLRPMNAGQTALVCSPFHMEQNRDDLIACALGEDEAALPFFAAVRSKTHQFIRMLAGAEAVQTGCMALSPFNIAVDIQGNVWSCHNFMDFDTMTHCLGNLFAKDSIPLPLPLKTHRSPKCTSCLCRSLCHGGCHLEDPSEYSCWKKYHQIIPVFYDAVACLTGGEYRLCRIIKEIEQ